MIDGTTQPGFAHDHFSGTVEPVAAGRYLRLDREILPGIKRPASVGRGAAEQHGDALLSSVREAGTKELGIGPFDLEGREPSEPHPPDPEIVDLVPFERRLPEPAPSGVALDPATQEGQDDEQNQETEPAWVDGHGSAIICLPRLVIRSRRGRWMSRNCGLDGSLRAVISSRQLDSGSAPELVPTHSATSSVSYRGAWPDRFFRSVVSPTGRSVPRRSLLLAANGAPRDREDSGVSDR